MKNRLINQRNLCGLAVGGVNGLFGGGGGMIAVPLLKDKLNYPPKQAHATAIAIIAPVCAISAVVYAVGGYVNLAVAIPSSLGSAVGGWLGAKLLNVLPQRVISLLFIAVMLWAGVRMVMA